MFENPTTLPIFVREDAIMMEAMMEKIFDFVRILPTEVSRDGCYFSKQFSAL